MSGRYLTDLADVARAAGLVVREEAGWQTRARGSGGYASGRPTHVMIHHTASGPSSDGQGDVNYICHGSENAPICNLYLDRSGVVWICAAGCTNTNGSGGPLDGVPADSMNTYAIGIEIANGGTGEPYPDAQQRAAATLVAALCLRYAIPWAQISTHYLWAPGRKCDNTGPSRWAPPGTPGGCNGAGAWDIPAFRLDVAEGWPSTPPPLPEPPQEEDPVDHVKIYRNASEFVLFRRAGQTLLYLTRGQANADRASLEAAGVELGPESSSDANVTDLLACYVLVGPPPPGGWPPVSAFRSHQP